MNVSIRKFLILFALMMTLACGYCNQPIQSYQVGLEMGDGVQIDRVVPAGLYTAIGITNRLVPMDVQALTFEYAVADDSDASLVTRDSQPIGITITVTVQRKRDDSSVRAMWSTYNAEAISNEVLGKQVISRLSSTAKSVTTEFTLNEMLGITPEGEVIEAQGREVLNARLSAALAPSLDQIYVSLLNVMVNNIDADDAYLASLKGRALATVQQQEVREKTELENQKLQLETATTNLALERARRDNLVNAELAKVYETSPEYLALKMLEIWSATLDETDQIIFIPANSPLSIFLSDQQVNNLPGVVTESQSPPAAP